MNKKNIIDCWLLSGLVFFVFFAYYAIGAHYLPSKAGPDYGGSRATADFYLKEGRLAIVPKDEEKMNFSIYGSSRLLRPPLGFAAGAAVAKVNGVAVNSGNKRFYLYRLASAAFGALTLALIFTTLLLLFKSSYVATFGTLTAGLWPQFAFTSMYLNDDSSAIFAVSCVVLAMTLIIKNGLSTAKILFFALTIGIIVISKPSAWIFISTAVLFYLFYIFRLNRNFLRDHMLMIIAFIGAGGWWLCFNMINYGWNDPLLLGVGLEMTGRHSTIDLSKYGFQAEGAYIKELLLRNHKGFIQETYMALIGYLDWLKIRLGPVQYGFYLFLIVGIVANIAFLISETVLTKLKDRRVQFEWLLYVAIIIQIFAYTWLNVYKDIQIQGKYLLPVMLPMLILGLSFYTKLIGNSYGGQTGFLRSILLFLLLLVPIAVHLEALVNHVFPFYWPELKIF